MLDKHSSNRGSTSAQRVSYDVKIPGNWSSALGAGETRYNRSLVISTPALSLSGEVDRKPQKVMGWRRHSDSH